MTNGEIIRQMYAAFGRGDIPAVLATLDGDINWVMADGFPYSGTFVGPESVLENLFMKLGTEWENWSAGLEKVVEDGEEVIGLGTYTAKYLKTGKSISVPFAHAWTLKDGKVVHYQQYTDTAKIAESLV